MKVYIKKRWVKQCLKAGKSYEIPQQVFESFGGKVLCAELHRGRSVKLLPSGWWLPSNKVKLVS